MRAPWSARLFNPCFFLRNIKVSWRVADGWKHKISWISLKNMKFSTIAWNFIKSYNFLAFHQFSALRRWHAKRTVIPMVFQWLQRAHSSPGTPKSDFSWKYWILTKMMGNLMKFGEIWPQNWVLRILRGPWPARAGNLNIPIGILRFLSLPGPHGSLQNRKKLQIPAQIALFHSKTGFSASGAKKIAPERYVYVGFWAGAANVDFWSPRCVFGAQNHKRGYFIGFHRIL